MSQPYLEVTYRKGRPLAAYLYLPRQPGDTVAHSEPIDDVLVVDRTADGRPIGVEILDPKAVTVERLNDLLRGLQLAEIERAELAPLQVA
ncbi:MAG: DUF2283 domain-containing protein [Gemmataceae bacterium]|nr:DUF2283 domain-containing protein [Gemmataceae bacterium]